MAHPHHGCCLVSLDYRKWKLLSPYQGGRSVGGYHLGSGFAPVPNRVQFGQRFFQFDRRRVPACMEHATTSFVGLGVCSDGVVLATSLVGGGL